MAKYKLRSSSLLSFPQPPVTSSVSGANFLLRRWLRDMDGKRKRLCDSNVTDSILGPLLGNRPTFSVISSFVYLPDEGLQAWFIFTWKHSHSWLKLVARFFVIPLIWQDSLHEQLYSHQWNTCMWKVDTNQRSSAFERSIRAFSKISLKQHYITKWGI